jgi:hypothetical protein
MKTEIVLNVATKFGGKFTNGVFEVSNGCVDFGRIFRTPAAKVYDVFGDDVALREKRKVSKSFGGDVSRIDHLVSPWLGWVILYS